MIVTLKLFFSMKREAKLTYSSRRLSLDKGRVTPGMSRRLITEPHKDRQPLTLSLTPTGNLDSPINSSLLINQQNSNTQICNQFLVWDPTCRESCLSTGGGFVTGTPLAWGTLGESPPVRASWSGSLCLHPPLTQWQATMPLCVDGRPLGAFPHHICKQQDFISNYLSMCFCLSVWLGAFLIRGGKKCSLFLLDFQSMWGFLFLPFFSEAL